MNGMINSIVYILGRRMIPAVFLCCEYASWMNAVPILNEVRRIENWMDQSHISASILMDALRLKGA